MQLYLHTITKCALPPYPCSWCSVCAYLDTPCHNSKIVVTCELIVTCSYCCRVQAMKAADTMKAVIVSADTQCMWSNAFTSWTSRTVELLYLRKHAIVAIYNYSLNQYSCYSSDQRLQWSAIIVHMIMCALLYKYSCSCSVCAHLDTPCTIVITFELIFTWSCCCRV
jgi:hypothetical protein